MSEEILTADDAFEKYYADILKHDFSVYGIFPSERPELETRFRNEIVSYCKSANPLTRDVWRDMTPEQRKKAVPGGKTPIWTMVGGQWLWLSSGGRAQTRLGEIIKEYRGYAEGLAREARERAGWKDDGSGWYRITPEGKSKTSNGMPIGKFAMPWGDDDAGDFDGTITDDTRFTV